MKAKNVIGLALIWVILGGVLSYADVQVTARPDDLRVQRLANLCKLWGAVGTFTPYLAYEPIEWDLALVQTIPRVKAASSPAEYQAAWTTSSPSSTIPRPGRCGRRPCRPPRAPSPPKARVRPSTSLRSAGRGPMSPSSRPPIIGNSPIQPRSAGFPASSNRSSRRTPSSSTSGGPTRTRARSTTSAGRSSKAFPRFFPATSLSRPPVTECIPAIRPRPAGRAAGITRVSSMTSSPPSKAAPKATEKPLLIFLTNGRPTGLESELSGLQSAGIAVIFGKRMPWRQPGPLSPAGQNISWP